MWRRNNLINLQNVYKIFLLFTLVLLIVHSWFFDKVLCIMVTITFITDVMYIVDIRMFILFCEKEENL